jgi:hypothetical protein
MSKKTQRRKKERGKSRNWEVEKKSELMVRRESREEEKEDYELRWVNENQRKWDKGESSENSFTIEKGVDLSQGEQKKWKWREGR